MDSAGSLITPSLITRLTPMLRRMAQRCLPREDVEDVVQETWLSVLRSVSRYEGRSSISVWIVGILKRRIADSYRRERPGHALREEASVCEALLATDRMHSQQIVRLVEEALKELPALEREAVRLCDFLELGRTEAARRLGITPGYLRVALHRGHNRLASVLSKQESAAVPAGVGPQRSLRHRSAGAQRGGNDERTCA